MRRKLATICLLAFAGSSTLFAQSLNEPPKQTARQALIEMFLGKGPNDFVKHLPEETRHTLLHKGDTAEGSWALRLAQLGRELTVQAEHLDTFDDGPTLLVMNERGTKEKIELFVEHDSLMGESDEIELSIKHSKDGQETPLPVVPRFTFTLQQEKDIWRLTEITAAAHIPLTDPDYLKSLRKMQDESNDGMIQMRVNMIVGAEKAYAAQHHDRGYVCNLSTVFAQEQAAPAQNQEQGNQEQQVQQDQSADDSGQDQSRTVATGYMVGAQSQSDQPELWNGYRFTLSGCEGSPASKFVLTAAPTNPDASSEAKTFCTDESSVIKFVTGGKASSCMSNGQPLNAPVPPPAEPTD
jgi:hypothetical protein